MSTGSEYTRKYGRKIGWFVFAGLFEKVCFPAAVLLLAIFHPWVFLATVAIESLLVFYISSVLVLKQNLFRHILISVAATPIRYAYLVFDLFVLVRFLFDLAFKRSLTWRK